jgi:hypothetical protein
VLVAAVGFDIYSQKRRESRARVATARPADAVTGA